MRMWSRAATRAPATAHLKLPLTARRAFASARPTEQKIQALKWTIPLEFAQQMSLFWAKSHYCKGSRFRLFLSMFFPQWIDTPTFELVHTSAFYLPVFYLDGLLRTRVNQGQDTFDVPVSLQDACFNAFNGHPLSHLQFAPHSNLSPDQCEPFDHSKHSVLPEEGTPVTVLPFQSSPLGLLALRKRGLKIDPPHQQAATDDDQVNAMTADLSKSVVKFFSAYPLYIPMFLSEIKCTQQDGSQSQLTVALIASGTGSSPLNWRSRACVYDQKSATEDNTFGWSAYSSGPGNQGLDQILVKIALGGQPVDGHVFQQLVAHSPDAVDFSICNDINQSWTNSPAVMDYAKCSGSNKVYLDALWKVEEAKAHARAVDFMGNQVGAIKLDVQNRKISKLNAEAVKEEIMGKIEQLESEAREVRPSWFA